LKSDHTAILFDDLQVLAEPDLSAVLRHRRELQESVRSPPDQLVPVEAADLLPVVRPDQVQIEPPTSGACAVAQQFRGHRVENLKTAGNIGSENNVRCVLYQVPIELLTFLQCQFGSFTLRNIDQKRADSANLGLVVQYVLLVYLQNQMLT